MPTKEQRIAYADEIEADLTYVPPTPRTEDQCAVFGEHELIVLTAPLGMEGKPGFRLCGPTPRCKHCFLSREDIETGRPLLPQLLANQA